MQISPMGSFSFGKTYTNPNGSVVDVSERAIKDAQITRNIAMTVRAAIANNEIDRSENPRNSTTGGEQLFFTIGKDGLCYITDDEDKIREQIFRRRDPNVKYRGETSLISDISAQDIETKRHFSCENTSIRAEEGTRRKYACFDDKGRITITYPEWAPKD